MLNLPTEVFIRILMFLDRKNLHTARQVSKEFNSVIMEHVLGTREGRKSLMRTSLQIQWRSATPARSGVTIGGLTYGAVLAVSVTDKIGVISSELPDFGLTKVSVVNTTDGVEVPGLSWEFDGEASAAILTPLSVLIVKSLDDEMEAVAWNINTKEKIYSKKFPFGNIDFDRPNQMMLGESTRLEITGTDVTETSQTHLPGRLGPFSHPHYLSISSGGAITLWKLDGTGFSRVSDLRGNGRSPPSVFCPARDLLFICDELPQGGMRLRVFSTQTGQIIKTRVLALTTGTVHSLSLYVNANQLVVSARQLQGGQEVLLVYDLDSLLSQSADQEIVNRIFHIGQPGSHVYEISLSKTSITAWLEGVDSVEFITMDFWNCQD